MWTVWYSQPEEGYAAAERGRDAVEKPPAGAGPGQHGEQHQTDGEETAAQVTDQRAVLWSDQLLLQHERGQNDAHVERSVHQSERERETIHNTYSRTHGDRVNLYAQSQRDKDISSRCNT